MDLSKVGSGLMMESFSAKNVVEDFLKIEYQEGLRNEFVIKDSLINRLTTDTITGKKKYKTFALGITDNVRAMGRSADRYQLGFDDYLNKGVETVEAEFDTTKLMATFSVTDEVLLKGTSDGSVVDVVKDSLDRMQMNLEHTMNRFTYGAPDGIIGRVTQRVSGTNILAPFSIAAVTAGADKPTWDYPYNKFYTNAEGGPISGVPYVVEFKLSNSHSILPGMGLMIAVVMPSPGEHDSPVTHKRIIGRVWQKINTDIHSEKIVMYIEKVYGRTETYGTPNTFGSWTEITGGSIPAAVTIEESEPQVVRVTSRQLIDTGGIEPEYHGLEAIVVNSDGEYDNIFGVNRSVYQSLRCTSHDLGGTKYVNEELLRDMSDHIALTTPDGTGVNLVISNHRIISAIEKSMYQFKHYDLDTNASGFQLGRPDIRFDNFVLMKDRYARDNNLYMLDTQKIGELLRRDFTWITSGDAEGVLSRRSGTELYEGIMNKYADMYLDAWRAHAVIKNCRIPGIGDVIAGQYSNIEEPAAEAMAASAAVTITPTSNVLAISTVYANAAEMSGHYVVDGYIISSETIPAGTTITINPPAIGGSAYVLAQPTKKIWLSDIIKGQQPLAATRTKLNGHTGGSATQNFTFTMVAQSEISTLVTVKVVTSKEPDLEGTHNATKRMVNPIVIGEASATLAMTDQS